MQVSRLPAALPGVSLTLLACPEVQPGAQHGLAMVPEEVRRARMLRCKQCGLTGAAMGCEVRSCKETFHLPCAMLQASGL